MVTVSADATSLTVEEERIQKAGVEMPEVVHKFEPFISRFSYRWQNVRNYEKARKLVKIFSNKLWVKAKNQTKKPHDYDDRPLYWARLQLTQTMRSVEPAFELSEARLVNLLKLMEEGSRGIEDIDFDQNPMKKILLTGFDPFFLDYDIKISNPSGIAALLLDGEVIEFVNAQGERNTAQINTVMIPVRFEDFDQGLIESIMAPFYALNSVDMITTVSMGRSDFDLERFPGKRRSAVTFPDNLNQYDGSSCDGHPCNGNSPNDSEYIYTSVIGQLNGRELPGPEFVEFSLPVDEMMQSQIPGSYGVNDNGTVIYLDNDKKTGSGRKTEITAQSLQELKEIIKDNAAHSGSGGSYLSNEISYRTIRLRNQLDSDIPTGHIHTPSTYEGFNADTAKNIVDQITTMLKLALPALPEKESEAEPIIVKLPF
ncbi:MAG: hypothetical protein GY696_38425 [Gammaproteobacteria bacterium]|nr:hypothetical protein [Gammaproteobacteria bacterium]